MAFSPTDPVSAWRSDWNPLWMPLLLVGVVSICYLIMPSNDVVQKVEQTAQKESVPQQSPVLGILTRP